MIIIIGGGISGLAAAFELSSGAIPFRLLEASAPLGGLIRTERRHGFTIDAGADSMLASKPAARALCGTGARAARSDDEEAADGVRAVGWASVSAALSIGAGLADDRRSGAGSRCCRSPRDCGCCSSVRVCRLESRREHRVVVPAAVRRGDRGPRGAAAARRHSCGRRRTTLGPVAVSGGGRGGGRWRPAHALAAFRDGWPVLFALRRNGDAAACDRPTLPAGTVQCGAVGHDRATDRRRVVHRSAGRRPRVGRRARGAASCDGAAARTDRTEAATLFGRVPTRQPSAWRSAGTRRVAIRCAAADSWSRGRRRFRVTACTWVSSKWEGRAPAGHVLLRAFIGGVHDPVGDRPARRRARRHRHRRSVARSLASPRRRTSRASIAGPTPAPSSWSGTTRGSRASRSLKPSPGCS